MQKLITAVEKRQKQQKSETKENKNEDQQTSISQ